MAPIRYSSTDEDSARWRGFLFRPGDLVVCTRSKHGTTWVQAILLLLIHRRVELPAPLAELSPWLDHRVEPRERVFSRLEAQRHRRVVKTHTPLDGLPMDERVTYVIAARHPLDAAVSLYHQGDNIDRERLHRLTGVEGKPDAGPRPPVEQWLRRWIRAEADPVRELDSLPGVFRHLRQAWSLRRQANVTLVHFADLLGDLAGQMERLAELLGLEPPSEELVGAATLEHMRQRADRLAPDVMNVLRARRSFFREGRSGTGAELLSAADLRLYHGRAAALAPEDLLAWLHRT